MLTISTASSPMPCRSCTYSAADFPRPRAIRHQQHDARTLTHPQLALRRAAQGLQLNPLIRCQHNRRSFGDASHPNLESRLTVGGEQ
jgi:hypothetical protein